MTLEDVVTEFNRPVTLNEHGCWLWLGTTDRYGYARSGGTLVHGYTCRRVGKIAGDNEELCHTCPNKNCINPDHLYVGTHYQNMQDATLAGTMGRKRLLLPPETLATIESMLERGCKYTEIIEVTGVSMSRLSRFKNRKHDNA